MTQPDRDDPPPTTRHAPIVSIGSINLDHEVLDLPDEVVGTVVVGKALTTSGGKAANVAVLCAGLGADVRLIGSVGDDVLAEAALGGPRRAGLDLSSVQRVDAPTAMSTVLVRADGSKSILLAPGANDAAAAATEVDAVLRAAPDDVVVVLDAEIAPATVSTALHWCGRRRLRLVLDPSPADRIDDTAIATAAHVTPDHLEARELTGIDCSDEDGARAAAVELVARGAGAAHVKLPEGGCVSATAQGSWATRAPDDLDVVDTTGAGDAFAAGLAWAVAAGLDVRASAVRAVAASCCVVEASGSQEAAPDPQQLSEMVARVQAASGG